MWGRGWQKGKETSDAVIWDTSERETHTQDAALLCVLDIYSSDVLCPTVRLSMEASDASLHVSAVWVLEMSATVVPQRVT